MRLSEIVDHLGIRLQSALSEELEITGISSLELATQSELSFLEQAKHADSLQKSRAGAILVRPRDQSFLPPHAIALLSNNPYLDMARLSRFFAKPPFGLNQEKPELAPGAIIGERVTLGNGSSVGARTIIMPNCVIGENVSIGEDCVLYPNVTLYRDTQLGNRVIVHAGAAIGTDGFGYAHTQDGEHIKIYHNGIAVLEDDVEIGSNSCVDRAVFGETRIKQGSKLDNLVHIAHNCIIGEHSLLTAQVALAGSTTTGRNVTFGGQSAAAGHLHIGDFATLAARSGVSKSIAGGKTYAGFPLLEHKEWLKLQAAIKGLLKRRD